MSEDTLNYICYTALILLSAFGAMSIFNILAFEHPKKIIDSIYMQIEHETQQFYEASHDNMTGKTDRYFSRNKKRN